jgi:type IV pilus assembly protein PilW
LPKTLTTANTPTVRLQADGIIGAMLSGGAAVPLTDVNTIAVSDFVITPSSQSISGASFCTKTCTTNCPRLILREFEVLIKGNIPGDTTINRSMRSNVRVRNDYFDGQCPT